MTPDPKGPAMTDQSGGLLVLAERCEKAEGPDRELDGSIGMAVQTPGYYRKTPYTASLDAALSLVPDNCAPSVMRLHDGVGKADCHISGGRMVYADGATPALALCAAALRARAAITLATGAAS